ncbi:MAG: septal ring lytic transglycosylase RlpA family protein [Paludibacteraceae bacterium]
MIKVLKLFMALFMLTLNFGVKSQNRGTASYYSNKLHKSRMSNGEHYHKDSLICAHRTFPFGTLIKVRNLKIDKEVVVKVTDRGPFTRGRIIDVSYAAAQKLGFAGYGLAKVEIEKFEKDDYFSDNPSRYDSLMSQIRYIPVKNSFLKTDNCTYKTSVEILRKSIDKFKEQKISEILSYYFNNEQNQKKIARL